MYGQLARVRLDFDSPLLLDGPFDVLLVYDEFNGLVLGLGPSHFRFDLL